MSDQGHWIGETVDPERDFGFVYLITDLTTGKKYVGRKQIWMAKQGVKGCKTRVMDRGSAKWNCKCWKESNWKEYCGSSKNLLKHMNAHKDHEFEFRVLRTCRSRGVLTYCECMEQWDRRVLHAKLPNGEYEYFNGQIGAIKFRPPDNMSEEQKQKIAKAMKGKPKPKGFQDGNTNGKGTPKPGTAEKMKGNSHAKNLKGYKQSEEHIRKRIEARKRTMEARKENA